MANLFVSYSHADQETVRPLTRELQDLGYEVWIDISGIKGGTQWGTEIVNAITNSDFFLLFVSSNSIKSDGVRREVDLACKQQRKIIPLRLEKVNIPPEWDYQLAGIQWIECSASDWKSRLLVAIGDSRKSPARDVEEKRNGSDTECSPPYNPLPREAAIIAKIEHLSDNKRLSEQQKEALIPLFKAAADYSMKEVKVTPQEMNSSQVTELYQNSSYTVAYFLASLTEYQSGWMNFLPADPQTDQAISLLTKIQHQIMLVATVAEVHSPAHYELFRFESQMLLPSIKTLKGLLAELEKYLGGSDSIPDDIQMQIDTAFDNLVFEVGRMLLLMQELVEPNRRPILQ